MILIEMEAVSMSEAALFMPAKQEVKINISV